MRASNTIKTRKGWLLLAVIIAFHSRRVVCWEVLNRMMRDLAIRALEVGANLRKPPPERIHHAGRGPHYCAHDYQKIPR